MPDDCIFCKIVLGGIPAYKVGESDRAVAFLDIHPIHPGHTLVIPRAHVEDVLDLSKDEYDAVMGLAQEVGNTIRSAFNPPRVGYLVKGFDIPHAHVHVFPMYEDADMKPFKYPHGLPPKADDDGLALIAKKMKPA